MSRSVINRYRYFLPWLLLWSCLFAPLSLAKLPSITPGDVPDYDYTQTRLMVLYGPDGYVLLANPFENPAPNMGALVYEMILLYVPHLQPFMMPPEEPTHVLDLIMKDQNNIDRLGQRLYIGNPWLSDGKSIALMTAADYQKLAFYLDNRYEKADPLPWDPETSPSRPTQDELPSDWLAERESIRQAIERLPVSDYQPDGYDPGAQIRRRYSNADDELNAELFTELPEKQSGELSGAKTTKHTSVDALAAEPEAVAPEQRSIEIIPEEQVSTEKAGEASPTDQKKFFPVLLMLMGLLLLTLLLRHQRRKKIGP